MKKKSKISIFILVAFLAAQFFRPEMQGSTPIKPMNGVPVDVQHILRTSCYNCHSDQVQLAWFDNITPANFLVNAHIQQGRKALNFSNWDSLATPQQSAALYYALNKVLAGEMPLASYTALHPEAKLKKGEIDILKRYVTSLSPRRVTDSTNAAIADRQYREWINGNALPKDRIKPAPNGITYIDGYRQWKAISTTDRFDNGTMRIIFGNDVVIKAISEKNTNPWPDGAVFAKAAWKQQVDANGNIATGQFIQVEFMIKDQKKYASTAGWGWARWRGDDLKPYGDGASFDRECISCHQPVKKSDYVFTTPFRLNVENITALKNKNN